MPKAVSIAEFYSIIYGKGYILRIDNPVNITFASFLPFEKRSILKDKNLLNLISRFLDYSLLEGSGAQKRQKEATKIVFLVKRFWKIYNVYFVSLLSLMPNLHFPSSKSSRKHPYIILTPFNPTFI